MFRFIFEFIWILVKVLKNYRSTTPRLTTFSSSLCHNNQVLTQDTQDALQMLTSLQHNVKDETAKVT